MNNKLMETIEQAKPPITFNDIHKMLRDNPSEDLSCRVFYSSKLYDELIEIDDTVLRVRTTEYMNKLGPIHRAKTTNTAEWMLFFDDIYIKCTMVRYEEYLDVIFAVPKMSTRPLGDIK